MNDTYGRYIVILPVVEIALDLLPFGKRYTWMRSWEDLRELHGTIIGQQFKIFIYVEDAKRKPSKLFFCTLIDARSEQEAYELGTRKVEEFVYLMSLFFRRGFRILAFESATLPVPNVRSLKEIDLQVDEGYVSKIITPRGKWTVLSPHFGEITHNTTFPTYFEMPKMEGKVSHTAIAIRKKDLDEVEDFFVRLGKLNEEKRGLLKVVGQLYSTAISTEVISISYLLLWEILEVYSLTQISLTPLLDKKTLNRIRGLLKQGKYKEKDAERIVSLLGMQGQQTETEMISAVTQRELFPKEKINEINIMIRDLRKTRSMITHPKVSSNVEKATLLDHYKKLKEIVDKLILLLSRSDRHRESALRR